LLNRVKLFKDNRVNVVLATLVSFIAIAAADVVRNVNLFSYYLVILVFIFIAVLMLIALLGGKLDFMSKTNKKYFTWTVAVIMCLLIIYALYASGMQVDLGPISYDFLRSVIPIAIAILVFVLIVWFISSPGKKTEEEKKAEARAKAAKPTEQAKRDEEQKKTEKDAERKARYELEKDIKRPQEQEQPLKFFKS
jgi:bacteriorhodopsin